MSVVIFGDILKRLFTKSYISAFLPLKYKTKNLTSKPLFRNDLSSRIQSLKYTLFFNFSKYYNTIIVPF